MNQKPATSQTNVSSSKIAFVAGGGAVKAYCYHLGVLEGLKADGFFFCGGSRAKPRNAPSHRHAIDCYLGASAGALVVAALAGGKPLSELRAGLSGKAKCAPRFGYRTLFVPGLPQPMRYLRRLRQRRQMTGLSAYHLLDLGGIFTTSGVERFFRKYVLPTNRFDELAAELYVTATQTDAAGKVVFGPGIDLDPRQGCTYRTQIDISRALAASVSVPPMFRPYQIVDPNTGQRDYYYDGEVRDPLSLDVARDIGAQFVIASSVWSPYCGDSRYGTVADLGMSMVAEQALHQINEQKVQREREHTAHFDLLLDAIDAYHAKQGINAASHERFKGEVCRLLGHRPQQTLYIEPAPADRGFFLGGAFRFNERLIDRAVDVGLRAYGHAKQQNEAFFEALACQGSLACSAESTREPLGMSSPRPSVTANS